VLREEIAPYRDFTCPYRPPLVALYGHHAKLPQVLPGHQILPCPYVRLLPPCHQLPPRWHGYGRGVVRHLSHHSVPPGEDGLHQPFPLPGGEHGIALGEDERRFALSKNSIA